MPINLINRSREIEVLGKFLSSSESASYLLQKGLDLSFFGDSKLLKIFTEASYYFLSNRAIPDKPSLISTLGTDYLADINRALSSSRFVADNSIDSRLSELDEYRSTRSIKQVLSEVWDEMNNGTIGKDLLTFFMNSLNKVINDDKGIDIITIDDIYDRVLKVIESRRKGEVVEIIPSGWNSLDDKINGFPIGMTVIAARPGMGKTMFLDNLLRLFAIEKKIPSLLISLEMSNEDNMERIICSLISIDYTKILKGNITENEFLLIQKAKNLISKKPAYFAFSPSFTVEQVQIYVRLYKKIFGVIVYLIDYLQLFHEIHKYTDAYEYASIVDKLRKVSKNEKVVFICAAQLNRHVDDRKDKIPRLSDVADTDRAAKDSELVLGLYDDEYYHRDESKFKGILKVPVLKGRKTRVGQVAYLRKIGEFQRIDDFSEYEF